MVGTRPFVKIGQNVGGFRQNKIAILEDRHIILPGDFIDLRAHPSAVGNDDLVTSQTHVSQFLTDDSAVRAPIDMEKSHSHDRIRLPGKRRK